ncbi:MAG: HK97 gp10 family phage protein [Idiomarina sp.]|nr:HK97 gp10 family phage protein [Idiomarina sp.]
MTFRIDGLRGLVDALNELGGEYAVEASERALREALKIPAKAMRQNIPVRSGKGRRSIRYKIDKRTDQLASGTVGVFGRRAWYMRLVERGVAPHDIPSEMRGRGRNRRRNKAVAVINGRVVGRVKHPGFQPKSYLADAFESSQQRTLLEFRDALAEMIVVQATRKARDSR